MTKNWPEIQPDSTKTCFCCIESSIEHSNQAFFPSLFLERLVKLSSNCFPSLHFNWIYCSIPMTEITRSSSGAQWNNEEMMQSSYMSYLFTVTLKWQLCSEPLYSWHLFSPPHISSSPPLPRWEDRKIKEKRQVEEMRLCKLKNEPIADKTLGSHSDLSDHVDTGSHWSKNVIDEWGWVIFICTWRFKMSFHDMVIEFWH